MFRVVDQLDVQRMGRGCGRYPVSCLIRGMLVRAGLLAFGRPLRVLDLTFGEGRFWKMIPQAYVVGFDVNRLRWVRRPQEFYEASAEKWRMLGDRTFDLVAVDPPFMAYRRGQKRRLHYEDVNCSCGALLREAEKAATHYNAPLLVHFPWRVVPYGFRVVEEAWFKPRVRVLNTRYHSWYGILQISIPDREGER